MDYKLEALYQVEKSIGKAIIDYKKADKILEKYNFYEFYNSLPNVEANPDDVLKLEKLGFKFRETEDEAAEFRNIVYAINDFLIIWLVLYMLDDYEDIPKELVNLLNFMLSKANLAKVNSVNGFSRPLEIEASYLTMFSFLEDINVDDNLLNDYKENVNNLFSILGKAKLFSVGKEK